MPNVLTSRPLEEIGQEINVAVKNRVTDAKTSVLVGNGIARVDFVNDLDFATRINTEAYGELFVINDDESLALSRVSGPEFLQHEKREFGEAKEIKHSDIVKLTGANVSSIGASFQQSQAYAEAKAYLMDRARGFLSRSATNKIMQCVYGALFGTVNNTFKGGLVEPLTYGVTNGGNTPTVWSNVAADIVNDMLTIEAALGALPESQTIRNGHTIMGTSALQAVRRNNSIKALFNNTASLSALPEGPQFDSTLESFFGKIVRTDESIRTAAATSTKLLNSDYIIVTPETVVEPIVTVLVAPTQLDPKYVNSDAGTGFSVHEYDGLVDGNQESHKPGSFTAGIRGRIAIFIRNPQRIHVKRVLGF